MGPDYSSGYIDRLFADRDALELYGVLRALGGRSRLPEECWAFVRLVEWMGSVRSGVWQYYEGVSREEFRRLRDRLAGAGWPALHEQYTAGMHEYAQGSDCQRIDQWIDDNEDALETFLWGLAEARLDWIMKNRVSR